MLCLFIRPWNWFGFKDEREQWFRLSSNLFIHALSKTRERWRWWHMILHFTHVYHGNMKLVVLAMWVEWEAHQGRAAETAKFPPRNHLSPRKAMILILRTNRESKSWNSCCAWTGVNSSLDCSCTGEAMNFPCISTWRHSVNAITIHNRQVVFSRRSSAWLPSACSSPSKRILFLRVSDFKLLPTVGTLPEISP